MVCPVREGGYDILSRGYPSPWTSLEYPPATGVTLVLLLSPAKDLGPETGVPPPPRKDTGLDLGPETGVPTPCGTTHTCEDITVLIYRMRAVKIKTNHPI